MQAAFSAVKKTVLYTVTGFSSCYCCLRFVCGLGKCEDVSMQPAIHDGDIVLITPFSVNYKLIQKGDIVFCRSPKNPRAIICKRVVGMEGDTVFNDEKGFEEYIEKGRVWLEGDNKEYSIDSRRFGALPYGLLISRVAVRVWPKERFGFIGLPGDPAEKKAS